MRERLRRRRPRPRRVVRHRRHQDRHAALVVEIGDVLERRRANRFVGVAAAIEQRLGAGGVAEVAGDLDRRLPHARIAVVEQRRMRAPISGWPIEFSAPIAPCRTETSASPIRRSSASKARPSPSRASAAVDGDQQLAIVFVQQRDQRCHRARVADPARARRPRRAGSRASSLSQLIDQPIDHRRAEPDDRLEQLVLRRRACRAAASARASTAAPRSQPSTITN